MSTTETTPEKIVTACFSMTLSDGIVVESIWGLMIVTNKSGVG